MTPTPTVSPTLPPLDVNIPTPTIINDNISSGSGTLTEVLDSSSLLDRLTSFLSRTNSIRDRVDSFIATSSTTIAQNPQNPTPPLEFSQNYTFPENLQLSTLKVIESTSLADTTIAGSLMVDATLLLENNRISSLSDSLAFSAVENINFMGGQMIVDKNGNLTVSGTLIAEGGVVTNEIKSLSGDLTINLSSLEQPIQIDPATNTSQPATDSRIGGFGQLLIKGNNDKPVASIDAAGNATFSGVLTASKLNFASDPPISSISGNLILTAADNFLQNGINAPAIRASGSAGSATLPAGALDLYVFNNDLSDKTLTYITPTSPTQNRTLYVASKQSCSSTNGQPQTANCQKFFVISLDTPVTFDIKFNWWMVN